MLIVVINADDFGLSSEINGAIVESIEAGLVSSATVMPTMPAFDEACAVARDRHFADRIGVHLTLSAGTALTSAARACPRLCDEEGRFRPEGPPGWHVSRVEAAAIASELGAQVEATTRRGVTPSHLDSHHHVHTRWAILPIVIATARLHGIRALRLSRNLGRDIGNVKRLYKALANSQIRAAGLAPTRYFGSTADAQVAVPRRGPIELMTHPGRSDDGSLTDATRGSVALDVSAAFWRQRATILGYRDLVGMQRDQRG